MMKFKELRAPRLGSLSGLNGITNSTSRTGVTKPGASTPITMYSSPLSRIDRPTMPGRRRTAATTTVR